MLVLYAVGLYLIIGILFAIPFLTKWIVLLDESAEGTSFIFRLLLIPGSIIFWPVLLRKYLRIRSKL
jgi:hypothetical protein